MMRSLFSGVSGLRNHQTRMDVIANNISNVNTVGFKASRVVFQDIYSQTASYATASNNNTGGTNPVQIGLGVRLATIDVLHTSSATSRTDNPLDIAIEGDGYFTVMQGDQYFYTRAGNLYVDEVGNLITGNGDFVMGLALPLDSNGDRTGDPPYNPLLDESTTPPTARDGRIDPGNTTQGWGKLNVSGFTGITIDDSGIIRGMDASGLEQPIGYIALATFSNNSGLEKVGSSLYKQSENSGDPRYSVPSTNGAGKLNVGGLEMSNVDLSNEFTDMIITQRGFQANSRIITTSDSMLEELVNLKR